MKIWQSKRWSLLPALTALLASVTASQLPCLAVGGELKLPVFQKLKLKNDLPVLVMEQREVPIVSFQVLIKSGSTSDPEGKEGLAFLTTELLRKGTVTRSADEIAAELDFVGGRLQTETRHDMTRISAEFMRKDLQTGLALLVDLIRNPSFPVDEVSKLSAQQIDNIRSAKDEARGIIGEYFNAFLYGKHPYGRPVRGNELSLGKLNRDDAAKFHARHYVPANGIVAVVGDFTVREIKEVLQRQLESWPKGPVPVADLPPVAAVRGKRLLLIDKPDSTQTFFQIGNLGIARSNPDRTYIQVVNTLLGGRFTSMLNSELRNNSGLSYGAYSRFELRKLPGPFVVSSFTRNETTQKALDLALEVVSRLHQQGLTQEALNSAKNYIKGQFPLTIETSDQLAALLGDLEFYGLDASEVDGLYSRIDSMTLADARRVIPQYFPVENLIFVLIGKAADIAKAAAKYAPEVERKSITEPSF